MPPINHQVLYKRTDPGTSFSIIFGIIAASVVTACAIWGFVIPKWRQFHLAHSSRTEWSDEPTLTTGRCQRFRNAFPSHPAIKPLLSKPSAAQILPTYDPRIESPFPGCPEPGISKRLDDITPRTYSVPTCPTTTSSNGLFTPIRGKDAVCIEARNKCHTVPRAIEAKHFTGKSTDFGDAKDFILAVPEPLMLKPREAGRPPAVVRHLEKYGALVSVSPASSDKLPHPNKLFRAIQNADARSSLCSSTSMRLDHRESDAVAAVAAREVTDALNKAIEEGTNQQRHHYNSSNDSSKASSFVDRSHATLIPPIPHNGLTALHRLQSYRSLTGYQPPKLTRAGTISRPKTPVDELRRLYNYGQRHEDSSTVSLPKIVSDLTIPTSLDNNSEADSISTSATSPTLAPNALAGLQNRVECRSFLATTESPNTFTAGSMKNDGKNLVFLSPVSNSEPQNKKAYGFDRPGRRCKPAPPAISTNCGILRTGHHSHRSSFEICNAEGSVLFGAPLRSRARASSMYSRDTHGFSFAPTPTTPDQHSPMVDIFAEHDIMYRSVGNRESVKTRISEWTQRIEGNPTPPLPSFRSVVPAPQICKAVSLPTMNQNDSRKKQVEPIQSDSSCSSDNLGEAVAREDTKIAPGGALWI